MRSALALSFAATVGCFSSSPNPPDAGDASSSDSGVDAVVVLFSNSCALGGCHVAPNPALQLDLSPSAFQSNLVGVPAAEIYGGLRVRPSDSTDTGSYLLCKIDPECVPVGDHMPLDGGLAPNQIALLRAWVASLPPDKDASAPTYGYDATPPAFAGATSATPGPSSITLGWSAATDNVTASSDITYLVYQAASSGGESFASPSFVSPAGATSFAVGKLAPSTTYYFVVRARDLTGNVDANTIEVSATTPATVDSTPPSFAGASSASAQSPSAVALSWPGATDDYSPPAQISYSIYAAKSSGGESFTAPDMVTLAGATSATVEGLAGGTAYWFVVRARDQAGNVDPNTKEVTATTAPVSFATDVWPLFKTTCTTSGCHVGAHPAEAIDLSAVTSAYGSIVGVPSSQCAGSSIVEPSSPATSYLLQKLRGYGSCFVGWQMPEQAAPFTATQIDLVGAWIGAGALND